MQIYYVPIFKFNLMQSLHGTCAEDKCITGISRSVAKFDVSDYRDAFNGCLSENDLTLKEIPMIEMMMGQTKFKLLSLSQPEIQYWTCLSNRRRKTSLLRFLRPLL